MDSLRKIKFGIKFFVCFFITFSLSLNGQLNSHTDFMCEVKKIHPHISIGEKALTEVKTIEDLNPRFEKDWIETYNSVNISGIINGDKVNVRGINNNLTAEQKSLLLNTDTGTKIEVLIKYLPKNELKLKEEKELKFSFTPQADQPANHILGDKGLNTYLQTHVLNKVNTASYVDYELSAVKFTVAENGSICDAHLIGQAYQQSKNPNRDSVLLKAIENMPDWVPAQYLDGTNTKQEYVLMVGSRENCWINTLNVYPKY